MVFPEGTRSKTDRIGRFKKGAFFIAEKLNLDVFPILFHGTGNCIRKNDFMVQSTTVTTKFLKKIKYDDDSWGNNYTERCKKISAFFKSEYNTLKYKIETPLFYKDKLIKRYIYKGPVLEWYVKIKLAIDNYYTQFNDLIPQKATITDIGCGYGMMPLMLSLLSKERHITGIDYDKEKISVAQNSSVNQKNISFFAADACLYEYSESDIFIISDMLHYLPEQKQKELIHKCLSKLSPNGFLIIRDGDSDLKERHSGTKLTEIFSTQIFKFNKTPYGSLTYLSGKALENIVSELNFKVDRLDLTKNTSNIIFVIRRK